MANPSALKKVMLTKKIEGVIYGIAPQTAADIVTYVKDGQTTNVAAELAGIASTLSTLASSTDLSNLRKEIIGELSDNESLAESFDTIKEIASFLDQHDESIGALAALLADVGVASVAADPENEVEAVTATGIHAAVELLQSKVKALEEANGTNVSKSKSGASDAGNGQVYLDGVLTTIYDDTDLVTKVGKATEGSTPGSGLTLRIENLESGTLTNLVAKTGSDGVVTVTKGGKTSDVTVYGGDPTVITQDETHRFATDVEKANWNATITYTTTVPEAADAKDGTLYLVEIV